MIGNAMLVTSCPDCKATFRINVGILEKAGGQVRCGRCASIFDANAKLREVEESELESRGMPEFKFELQPDSNQARDEAGESEDEPAQVGESIAADSVSAGDDAPPGDESTASVAVPVGDDTSSDDDASAIDDVSVADDEPAEDDEPVLHDEPAQDEDVAELQQLAEWLPPLDDTGPPRTRLWAGLVAAAALLLVVQFVNHYRAELTAVPAFGPALALVYAGLGSEILPPVDLDQYDLLDLTAVAEPSNETQGWLVIETRVRNGGPKVQPYPHILVRLLDRWEDTVAARYFAPNEYAVTTVSDFSHMNVGSSVDAQFIIMDPGPNATGFELELCAKLANSFECESDDAKK